MNYALEYSDSLLAAKKAIDRSDYKQAEEILRYLLDVQYTQTDYQRLAYMENAAKQEYPDTLYTLGLYYETGNILKRDPVKASSLFKIAAEKGHSKAKLSYGLDLFYGTNHTPKNKALGLAFVKQAAKEGVKNASKTLKQLLAIENQ